MNDKYKGLLRVGSWIPVMILNGIVVFCYIMYMGTYLVPLLFGGYAYQHHSVESIFSEVIEFDERITNLLAEDTQLAVKRKGKIQKSKKKGLMLFFILHSLALFLYYGLVQTMTTQPGRVPKSWKDDIQKEIDQYLIQEDLMISRWKDDKRTSKSINRLPELLPFNQIEIKSTPFHEHDDSEVNYDDQVEIDREIQFDDDFKLQLNIKAKIELLDKPGRRFCKRCLVMKPPRTHHCRQCQICWLKMDHHCQFVNNCIGFGNYKYFLNLILFSSVLLIFMVSTYTRTFVYIINDPEVSDFLMVTVVLYYLFSWLLFIALLLFFFFHMRF